jgi:hypothetical protein
MKAGESNGFVEMVQVLEWRGQIRRHSNGRFTPPPATAVPAPSYRRCFAVEMPESGHGSAMRVSPFVEINLGEGNVQ